MICVIINPSKCRNCPQILVTLLVLAWLGDCNFIELSVVGLAYLGTCVRGERLAALGHSWALYTHDSHQAPPRTSSSIMRDQCQWGCLDTLTAPTLHLEASKPRLEIL